MYVLFFMCARKNRCKSVQTSSCRYGFSSLFPAWRCHHIGTHALVSCSQSKPTGNADMPGKSHLSGCCCKRRHLILSTTQPASPNHGLQRLFFELLTGYGNMSIISHFSRATNIRSRKWANGRRYTRQLTEWHASAKLQAALQILNLDI